MKALSLLLYSILFSCSTTSGQVKLSPAKNDSLVSFKKQKTDIDRYEFKHRKQLVILAKLHNRQKLVKMNNEDYPDNTDYIYTIVQDSTGRILAIEQSPYSESGDWYEEFKHYFDVNGKTFAFSIRNTVFDDSVKGGVAVYDVYNYYNTSFKLLAHFSQLKDVKGRSLKARKSKEFDFRNDPYHVYNNIYDCLKAYHINKSSL